MSSRIDPIPSPAATRRRRLGAALAALLALSLGTARAAPERYEIDPDHATVAFLVQHLGYARTLGSFRKVSGSFTFDEATGALGDLRIDVDTASVDTGHAKRDEHLRSGDFLDAAKYPRMTFRGAAAKRTGDRTWRIEGELELRGQRRPLVLEATWIRSAPYPIGPPLLPKPYVLGASATGSLRRSEFGMTYGVANGMVGDTVELLIEIEARRR
jgi:polyisoprenoid-binding protein YceI